MNSEYCYDIELKKAIQLNMRIVPVIIRSVAASTLPIFQYQLLPRDARPVFQYAERDEAWAEVVQEISKLVRK